MNEVFKKVKHDERKRTMIIDFMTNMYYGMKATSCVHLMTKEQIGTIISNRTKISTLNKYEYRCLECRHPVNCFIPKRKPMTTTDASEDDSSKDKTDEYAVFEDWIQSNVMTAGSIVSVDKFVESQAKASEEEVIDMTKIIEYVHQIVDNIAAVLLNTVQIGGDKLATRPLKAVHDIFHAILSQHIATAHINDTCTSIAHLWRLVADSQATKSRETINSLGFMKQACRKTIRIVASYGWTIFSFSHLVCHLVRVELVSSLSSRTTAHAEQ
jgi:hypothetical protein